MTQDGVVPARSGPSRRPDGDGPPRPEPAALHPADLSVALRAAVSGVGAGGPPAGGLARVRRKARIRQRNRAMLAGSAGVLVIVLGVVVAIGGRLSLVPSLTGGTGRNNTAGGPQAPGGQNGENPSAAGNTSRAIWPWTGPSSNATGPAIGPGAPATAPAASPGAAHVPLCSAAVLGISTALGVTDGATRYGVIDVTPQTACVVSDPPMVEVTNTTGNAAASVQILAAGPGGPGALPAVAAASGSMLLSANQSYEFQFAWVTPACPSPGGSPSPAASPVGPPPTTAYSLRFAVPGTGSVPGVTLNAACGAQVFVTNVYLRGVYPTPTPTPTPSAPATEGSPSTPPPPPTTSPAPPTDTASPEVSSADSSSPSAPQSAGRGVTVTVSAVSSR